MLAIVCWRWNNGFRAYLPEYVNRLARGYARNLSIPHRFYCITDETSGFSDDVTVVPTPEAAKRFASWPSPHGSRYPSCYRRLWTFSKEAAELGDVLMMTDIDCVITDELDPLIEHIEGETFVGWRPPTTWGSVVRVAGSTWLLRAGAHTEVWEQFSADAAKRALGAGQMGSDQAHISYCLASTCKVWPEGHGIYEAQDMKPTGFKLLPKDARIVQFNGSVKPWDAAMQRIPWIREHW